MIEKMLTKHCMQRFLMSKIIILILFLVCSNLHVFSNEKDAADKNSSGMKLLTDNRAAEAEKYFRDAIEENSGISYYYNNLAVSLMQQKKYSEAIEELNRAVTIDPGNVKAVSNLAVCYFYMSDYNKAYHYYRMAKKMNSGYVKSRFTRKKIKDKTEKIENRNYNEKEINKIINSVTEE